MAASEQPPRNAVLASIRAIVQSRAFDAVITGVILLQAVVLAMEATPVLFPERREEQGGVETLDAFVVIHNCVVAIFIVEAGLRLAALYPKPQDYFRSGWNSFDFAIIILSLLPVTGQFSTIARVVRLLRVTRLVTICRHGPVPLVFLPDVGDHPVSDNHA
jgi:voltage-gated sodium channel